MTTNTDNVSSDEAKQAIEMAGKMEVAGWRRGLPDRYFGAGVALLIASLFALYALQDPYPYIVFPIIGMALFVTAARKKSGAYGRDFPTTRASAWAMAMFVAVLLIAFFGSIVIRRTYDAAWVPLVTGLVVGLVVFLVSEHERRAYLTKIGEQGSQ